MDQYLLIPFLGGWTSINPSYFDFHQGYKCSHLYAAIYINLCHLYIDLCHYMPLITTIWPMAIMPVIIHKWPYNCRHQMAFNLELRDTQLPLAEREFWTSVFGHLGSTAIAVAELDGVFRSITKWSFLRAVVPPATIAFSWGSHNSNNQ